LSIDTSGLSGYAADWAEAYNSLGDITAANEAANNENYGNSAGPDSTSELADALSGTGFSSDSGYSGTSLGNDSKSNNVASGGSGSGYVFIPSPLNNTTSTNTNTGLLGDTENTTTNTTYTYTLDTDGNIVKVPSTTPLSSLTAATSDDNNSFNGNGYAYADKYGYGHVVNDLPTAQQYSGNGDVSGYTGAYGGGYALGSDGNRTFLPLSGAVAYGNDGSSTSNYASGSGSNNSSSNQLTSTATVNPANALAKMLGTNNAVNTRYVPTDADIEALYLKQYGNANFPEATKTAVLKAMKIMMGGV